MEDAFIEKIRAGVVWLGVLAGLACLALFAGKS